MRVIARTWLSTRAVVDLRGAEHLPARGPALIVARHYHHLDDGLVLIGALPRAARLFVALDWTQTPRERGVMESLCRIAGWPVALRDTGTGSPSSAYRPQERREYLRAALLTAVRLLESDEVLAIFPEGYPTIDPHGTRKVGEEFLPFAPGFAHIVRAAQRRGIERVPVLPLGFHYDENGARRIIRARLGQPLFLLAGEPEHALAARMETAVRALSAARS